MEWLALIIPLLACLVGLRFFRELFDWWEYLLPPAACILVILLCKVSVKTALVNDTEYWGSMVVEARYYESWQTWVNQTCSYECNCSTDKDGHESCSTCYRDCSYCDYNSAYWMAYDDAGNSWQIDRDCYEYLRQKWKCLPEPVNMHRSIDYSSGCGKNGNMFKLHWDGQIETSEASVTTHSYTNRVQASHSTFKLAHIPKSEAKKLGLYDYPKEYSWYKQKVILGLDTIFNSTESERIETKFQYFNGYYGSRNKVKLFLCLFYDKPLGISYKQEAYWDGGNQNELVICVGLDKQRNLQWVRPFSWTDKKRVLVDCREDIMNLGTFKPDSVYLVIANTVSQNVMYKDFHKDFSYLTVDLPTWSYWLIWILTILTTAGVWYWCYSNEYELLGD